MRVIWTIVLTLLAGSPLAAVPVAVAVVAGNEAVATREAWLPILDFVSDISGHDLQLRLNHDHASVIEGLTAGEFIFAVVDPLRMAEMRHANLAQPVVQAMRPDGSGIRTQLLVRMDSIIREIGDLNGHTVAVLPPGIHCAANELPSTMLAELAPDARLTPVLVDTPESIIKAIRYGAVDVGAFAGITPGAAFDTTGLRLIAESPPVAPWYVVVRSDYSPTVVSAIRDALLSYAGVFRFVTPESSDERCPPFVSG